MTQSRQQQTTAGNAGNATDEAPTIDVVMGALDEVGDALDVLADTLAAYDAAQQDAGSGRRRRGSSSTAATSGNGQSKPSGTAEAARRFGTGQ